MRRSRKTADNKPISRLGLYRKYKKLIDFEMFTHTRKIMLKKGNTSSDWEELLNKIKRL